MNTNKNTARHINTRTAWRPVLRPVSCLVIAAHLALALQPLSVLAQEKGQTPFNPQAQAQLQRLGQWSQKIEQAKAQKAKEAQSPADKVSDKLVRVDELSRGLGGHANASLGTQGRRSERLAELRGLLKEVDADAATVRAEFAATKAELVAKKLPTEIIARHDEAVAQFEQRATEFGKIAGKITSNRAVAPTGSGPGATQNIANADVAEDPQAIQELKQFFDRFPARKRHTPIDPGKLPWGSPKATPRMPAETREALNQQLTKGLAETAKSLATSPSGLQFTHPPQPAQAPQAADLAETVDVQLTLAIRAKAQELGHNPVAIHNWVRNNVQWLPTWGSIQGADGTLRTLRGNAFDTASLTIALLRASGIPARYQLGTVDIPAEQVMNWIGGVQKPEAALNLLYQGGVAARGIGTSRITTIRMEHVWVNAYVNWSPSRGAKDGGPDLTPRQHPNPNAGLNAWTPMDGSFKQYVYTQGMNLQASVPINTTALIAAMQEGATVTPNYVQNLNQANLQAQLAVYQNQLKAYIDSTPTGASSTVGDVLGSQRIQTRTFTLLPGTLPYATAAQGSEMTEVPDGLRWKITLSLFQTDNDRAAGSPNVSVERPVSQIGTKPLAISYEPSSAVDQNLITSAAQAGQTSFSAYLMRYTPKIKLGGDLLGAGQSQQPGVNGTLSVTTKGPLGEMTRDYALTAGTTAVLSVNPVGIEASQYLDRARDYPINQLNASHGLQDLAEEMLHQLGMAWWAQKNAAQDNLAAQLKVVQYTLPSHGMLLAPISVRHAFGVPRSATFRTRVMDVKHDSIMLDHREGDSSKRVEFVRTVGQIGSYMEGAIFDQAFNPFNPRGVSSISLLGQANSQNVRVYTLRSGDEGLISQLQISADVQNEIAAALFYGRVVTIPEHDVALGGYVGLGYVIEDSTDGSAAYQIDGGRSGGEAQSSDSVLPLPAMPDSQLVGVLLGSSLRQSGAKLAIDSGGMIVGLVLPAVVVEGAAIGLLVGLILILFMLAQHLSNTGNQQYPEEPEPPGGKRWRKYTRYQDFIVGKQLLYASNTGTFGGGGVYVADTEAEEQRGITCANLSPLDIARRFQIPSANLPPDPSLITGYVDIIEKRKNYLKVEQVGPNSMGQLEYLITKPIILVPELREIPGAPATASALVLIPGILEIDDVCTR